VKPQSWYALDEDAAKRVGREERDGDDTLWTLGAEMRPASQTDAQAIDAPALPDFWHRPAAAEASMPRILRPSEAAGLDAPAPLSPVSSAGAQRFARGLLIHALLAGLPALAPEARRAAAQAYLARRRVPEGEHAPLIAECFAVLEHKDFAPLFAENSRAEVSVVAALPEIGPHVKVSGQIDRLAVQNDCVLVADFKTNRPPPARAEDTPALYRAQMALYRAALEKIFPGKRIVCALVWTDGPRLMALPDALLDAELAQITKRFV
jgi:ATP-dependent helicase/nuclease subunit A